MQVDCYESLETLPNAVTEALSYRHGVAFFKSIEWFQCLAAHGLDTEATPRVYVASDNGTVRCALFCAHRHSERTLTSLTSFYTMEYGPALFGETGATGLAAIIAFIAAERPRWHRIDLRYLRDESDDVAQLTHLLGEHGFATHAYYQYDNWYLDVAGRSFDEYYRELSSRLRNTLKRKGRKAEREHRLRLEIYPVDHDSLPDAIRHYDAIYGRSWKRAEPFPGFMPALFKTCDALDIVRVGLAWVDETPAAAQIWINDNGRAVIYKLAYDERYAPLSIGSLLSKQLFMQAIDADGVHEIDYGVGNESYKRDWMSDNRTLGGLLACNRRTVIGRLSDWRERLAAVLRAVRRSRS